MNTTRLLPETVPALDAAQKLDAPDARTLVALDALALEKAMLDKLVVNWLEALRPEMERMAEQIVRQTAQEQWRAQAQKLNAPSWPECPRPQVIP